MRARRNSKIYVELVGWRPSAYAILITVIDLGVPTPENLSKGFLHHQWNHSLSIAEIGALYSADLPSPQLLSTKFSRWKRACASTPVDKRPDTLGKVLLFCDRDVYPNVIFVVSHSLFFTGTHNVIWNGEIQQSTQVIENISSFNHDRGQATCCNRNTLWDGSGSGLRQSCNWIY